MRRVITRKKSGEYTDLFRRTNLSLLRHGKRTLIPEMAPPSLVATSVTMDEKQMHVYLSNGQVINVPLTVTDRLLNATPSQRKNWRFIGQGLGIHWEDIDEDLSVAGL